MENPFEIIVEKLDRIEAMLSEIKRNPEIINQGQEKYSEIMNTDQAADFLSMSKATLYKYTFQRKIPHYKAGKRNYFKKTELVDYLTQIKVKTMDEIEQEAANYLLRRRRNRY